MPITSSAKKAHRQSLRRRTENNTVKRVMKETIKEFKELTTSDATKAEEMIPRVYKAIDKAQKKGVIEPNTAARKKSSIMRAFQTHKA